MDYYIGWFDRDDDKCLTTNSDVGEIIFFKTSSYGWKGCKYGQPVACAYCTKGGTTFNNCAGTSYATVVNGGDVEATGCEDTPPTAGYLISECKPQEHNSKYFNTSSC